MKFQFASAAVLAGLLLAACQTAPAATPSEPVAEDTPEVVLPAPPPADEPRVNEWGGEVPENKPAGDVDEGGLGDLS